MTRAHHNRDTDPLLHEILAKFPEALAAWLGLPLEAGYRASSPELKAAIVRCDVLLAPEADPAAPHALVELQLRLDPDAERSLLRKVLLYARHIDYGAPVIAFIIYGSRAAREKALPADVRGERGFTARFRLTRIVLPARGLLRPTSRVATVLLPLLSSRSTVERHLDEWYAELWTEPDPARRAELIEYLVRLATDRHRFTYEELQAMTPKIAYPELTPWESLLEEVRERERKRLRDEAREEAREEVRKEVRKAAREQARKLIVTIVSERFGRRPRWLSGVREVADESNIEQLVVLAATANDLETLRAEIERRAARPARPPRSKRGRGKTTGRVRRRSPKRGR